MVHHRIENRGFEIKNINKIHLCFTIAFFSFVCLGEGLAATTEYDVSADWSDEQNPNGVWTYTGNNGAVLTVNQPDWDVRGFFFSGQRAWANAILPEPNHVPMWFKASGPSALDVPGVGGHGSEGSIDAWVGVVWRSPVDGTVSITGGVWQALKAEIGAFGGTHRNRNSDWRLRHNTTILAYGNVSGIDQYTSRLPFSFSAGTAGGSLDGIRVATGDEIVLEFISPTTFAPFIGIDLVITATER